MDTRWPQFWIRSRPLIDLEQGSTLAVYRSAEPSSLPCSPHGPLLAVPAALQWVGGVPVGFLQLSHAALHGSAVRVPLLVPGPGLLVVEVPVAALQYTASPVVWGLVLPTVKQNIKIDQNPHPGSETNHFRIFDPLQSL